MAPSMTSTLQLLWLRGEIMGFLSRIAGTALSLALAAGGYQYVRTHRLPSVQPILVSTPTSETSELEHFSPAENLERLEMAQLRISAKQARRSNTPLRIAMYAFTDRALADLLIQEADRGTVVELYRDGEQYESEERNAARFRDRSTTGLFRGHRNIHIRVKPPSRSDLMHLKTWSDGAVLREGSANWSPAALKRQDNNLRFTRNDEEVRSFLSTFEAIWRRPANLVIQ
jgi:phosphatidylserine/phosphatidylglycerophosphate/cardiolipin synthase-like enzyme